MIESKHLILRQYTLDDLKSVHSYASVPDFSKYEPWDVPSYCVLTKLNLWKLLPIASKRLKEARKLADLSQKDLANKIPFSQVTVSGWESGTSVPAEVLPDIAEATGLPIEDLKNLKSKIKKETA